MSAVRPTYAELLRHPKWQAKRLRIMDLAGFKCEFCDDGNTTLNVHHCFYTKGAKPWEYEDYELLCLCEPCHEELTTAKASLDRAVGLFEPHDLRLLEGFAKMMQIEHFAQSKPDLPTEVAPEFGPVAFAYLALGWRHRDELHELQSRLCDFDEITANQLAILERTTRATGAQVLIERVGTGHEVGVRIVDGETEEPAEAKAA